MLIKRIDPFTGIENEMDINVSQEHLDRWQAGELIQNVMPHLSPDDREFLMTGIMPESWTKYVTESEAFFYPETKG